MLCVFVCLLGLYEKKKYFLMGACILCMEDWIDRRDAAKEEIVINENRDGDVK